MISLRVCLQPTELVCSASSKNNMKYISKTKSNYSTNPLQFVIYLNEVLTMFQEKKRVLFGNTSAMETYYAKSCVLLPSTILTWYNSFKFAVEKMSSYSLCMCLLQHVH